MAALQADETEQENALRLRGEARRDSLTAVARAQQRSGKDPAVWDVMGADTAWLMVDLLLKVQGMPIAALDPAYEDKEERRAIGEAAAVERSLRGVARQPTNHEAVSRKTFDTLAANAASEATRRAPSDED